MQERDLNYYINGLAQHSKVVLGRAITLVESKKVSDLELASKLMDAILPETGNSIRIGITGVPGVGKSTFIESFGEFLIGQGKKVAVLAVDPSSQITGGSILADKTRMERLSKNAASFIRPSAAGSALGGVNNKTREAVLLCEAAGYDVILIETVGVGQSETLVHGLVDFFLLLLLPGAGDELQGIKKGIMELADGLAINKADGDQEKLAKRSKADCLNALHLFSLNDSGWSPKVRLCSAIENHGLFDVWQDILEYENKMKANQFWFKKRKDQEIGWFEEHVSQSALDVFEQNSAINALRASLLEEIKASRISVLSATTRIKEKIKVLFS